MINNKTCAPGERYARMFIERPDQLLQCGRFKQIISAQDIDVFTGGHFEAAVEIVLGADIRMVADITYARVRSRVFLHEPGGVVR